MKVLVPILSEMKSLYHSLHDLACKPSSTWTDIIWNCMSCLRSESNFKSRRRSKIFHQGQLTLECIFGENLIPQYNLVQCSDRNLQKGNSCCLNSCSSLVRAPRQEAQVQYLSCFVQNQLFHVGPWSSCCHLQHFRDIHAFILKVSLDVTSRILSCF